MRDNDHYERAQLLMAIEVKYISLLALTKIVPSHPHLIAEYEAKIVSCIEDPDLSIRMRALDLISAMVRSTFDLAFSTG